MHNLRWILTIALLISHGASFASSAKYQSSDVISAIEANYSQIQTISCRVSQIRSYGNNKMQSELNLFFKSPDKLYLDYLTPLRQTIIANGTSCWGYSPEDNRAEKVDLTEANMIFSPLKLLGIDVLDELKEAFDLTIKEEVDARGAVSRVIILASPKTGGKVISQILITVDPLSWVISSLKIMDKKGALISQTLFEDYQQINNIWFPLRVNTKSLLGKQIITEDTSFSRLKLNIDIPDKRFDFVPSE
ncbi:outer membrane lipoprotein carrier protein LolA [Candidatus Desantisbacteria bacterium]|nr:outer membrane lipoprotein carrier protein LolA [Candidatus Desantisbacteria bacterium]